MKIIFFKQNFIFCFIFGFAFLFLFIIIFCCRFEQYFKSNIDYKIETRGRFCVIFNFSKAENLKR